MRFTFALVSLGLFAASASGGDGPERPRHPYEIVDTAEDLCFDATHAVHDPAAAAPFFGQDAQYVGNEPHYADRGDGTVDDLVTGLEWQKDPGEKKTWSEAVDGAKRCRTGGHDDWRLPTIKELYSLILFSGLDVDPQSASSGGARPFLDTRVFDFSYGDPAKGERVIDSQWASSTRYVAKGMGGQDLVFGVNFADGRIKGYPTRMRGRPGGKGFFVRYVRGNPAYGENDLRDGGDGTVTDRATGLVWTKGDSGTLRAGPRGDGRLTWAEALAFAEGLELAGHGDWRLPNAKELQSIVDYARSPGTTASAAIDPVFEVFAIRAEDGKQDYPCYWSSTTHADARGGSEAVYVAFGRALGWMRQPGGGTVTLLDVHGAGAQRSDPKEGDPAAFPHGRGPQGDVIRILNYVRAVRGGTASLRRFGPPLPASTGGGRDAPPPAGGRGFIERLDEDGDGRVSRREFDGPPERFRDFDRNGDGYIDESEAPTGPPSGAGGDRPPRGGPGR